MSWFSAIPIVGTILDKLIPDKGARASQQTELNKAEISGAPSSILRLWRGFVGWVLAILFAWELVGRTIIVTYWPDTTLPPSMLKEVLQLLTSMLFGV